MREALSALLTIAATVAFGFVVAGALTGCASLVDSGAYYYFDCDRYDCGEDE